VDDPRHIVISNPDTVATIELLAAARGQPADMIVRDLVSEAGPDRLFARVQELVGKHAKNNDPRPSDDEHYDDLGLPKF
jgi:hypothetical protein